MPSLTTTIQENSPLITYISGWTPGTSSDDKNFDKYSDSNFMKTNTKGSSASFTFNGTGVEIFGAKRGNHGLYAVEVDSTSYPPQNGSVPDPGHFQQSLFKVSNLTQGLHKVTITNGGSTFVDIDYISWVTDIGGTSDKLFINTVQDTDSSFVFSGPGWQLDPNSSQFIDRSGRMTTNGDDSFVYNFQGEGVSLYGSLNASGTAYTVQLDGMPQTFRSIHQLYRPQVLLYHAVNLPSSEHSLKFICQPESPGQACSIDFANVYTTTPPGTSHKSGMSAGVIVGIALGVAGFIVVFIVGLFFFFRYRRSQQVTAISSNLTTLDMGSRPPHAILHATHSLRPIPFAATSSATATVKGYPSNQSTKVTLSDHSSSSYPISVSSEPPDYSSVASSDEETHERERWLGRMRRRAEETIGPKSKKTNGSSQITVPSDYPRQHINFTTIDHV